MALAKIMGYVYAIQKATQFLPVDAMAFVRKHLLQAGWVSTSINSVQGDGTTQQHLKLAGGDVTGQYLQDQARPIGQISAWYVNFIDTVASSAVGGGDTPSILYLDTRRTFLLYRPSPSQGASTAKVATSTVQLIEAELFTDVNELRALAKLVGPVGIEIIDSDIMKYVLDQMKGIKDFLEANWKPLHGFREAIKTGAPPPSDIPAALQGLDKFHREMVKVGGACIMMFYQGVASKKSFSLSL